MTIYKFHLSERLQRLQQHFRDVHKRTIKTYLQEKSYNENITINNLRDIYVEPCVADDVQNRQIKVEELFSPEPFSGRIPRKVLLYGPGGIGKTMVALFLLDTWVDGRLPAFGNIFFFSMRDLSRVGKCSLTDLLFTHQGIPKPRAGIVDKYLENMSHSLVIFEDCGEDMQYTSKSESEHLYADTEVEISELIGSIISGKVIPGASVLVTARNGGVIEHRVFHRRAEIHGFDETRIDQYVSKFSAGNDTDSGTLESHIRRYIDNDNNISTFCYLPMLCNLICHITEMPQQGHYQTTLPTTVTELLKLSVIHFATEHHPDFKGKTLSEEDDDVVAHFKDPFLCHSKLAKEGMSNLPVQFLFSEEDMARYGLSKFVARQFSLLTVLKDKVKGSLSREETEMHHFVHLLMQEFLAAIAFLSNIDDIETQMANTPNLGQLDMVLIFMSGLTCDPANRDFLESLGCQTTMTAADLIRLIIKQDIENRRRNFKTTILLLLRLMYESRQPDLWALVKDHVLIERKDDYFLSDVKELNLDDTHINPVDQQALIYVIRNMDDVTMLK